MADNVPCAADGTWEDELVEQLALAELVCSERPQPTVAELLAAAEHYQRARDWDGDTAAGEAALHEAGHALQDLCRRIGSEGIA